jgi:hypothetical protein
LQKQDRLLHILPWQCKAGTSDVKHRRNFPYPNTPEARMQNSQKHHQSILVYETVFIANNSCHQQNEGDIICFLRSRSETGTVSNLDVVNAEEPCIPVLSISFLLKTNREWKSFSWRECSGLQDFSQSKQIRTILSQGAAESECQKVKGGDASDRITITLITS